MMLKANSLPNNHRYCYTATTDANSSPRFHDSFFRKKDKHKLSPYDSFVCTHFEGVLFNGLDDVFEEDLGRERVAVVDDGLSVGSVPAVQLHTATALHQCSEDTAHQHSQRRSGLTVLK